jgi:hypothetical protein
MKAFWKWCLVVTAFAGELLLDGSFEDNQWEISPSWALCNSHSCNVPLEISPGAHSGTHFVMAYPDRKVSLAQRFNNSDYAECQLEFYSRTTNRLNSFLTVYWNAKIVELTSYSKQSTLGDWDFYSITLGSQPEYLEIEINSVGNVYTTFDDVSLNCSTSRWTWTWSLELIFFVVIIGVALLTGARFLQRHHFISVALGRMGIQLPNCPHWFSPKKEATEIEEHVLSAFRESD